MNWHWPWSSPKKSSHSCDDRLVKAQRHARDLERRAEAAAVFLDARLKRNHWGETVAEIARRER